MSPWPGTPKSQQTPPINPPSVRFPFTLNEDSTQADVHDAIRTALNGLTVHEQAFANLPAQIAAQAKVAATAAPSSSPSGGSSSGGSSSAGPVTAFNAQAGNIVYFPSLGFVNDQTGAPAYSATNADNGKKIIVATDSSATVALNSSVTAPWFVIIDNDSSGIAYLVADSGPIYGPQSIPGNGFGIVFFDGESWWADATPVSGGGSGVSQIIAGTDITISPPGGTGAVTINASGAGGSYLKSGVTFGPEGGGGTFTASSTVPGATVGSAVLIAPNNSTQANLFSNMSAWVSAPNTVTAQVTTSTAFIAQSLIIVVFE